MYCFNYFSSVLIIDCLIIIINNNYGLCNTQLTIKHISMFIVYPVTQTKNCK